MSLDKGKRRTYSSMCVDARERPTYVSAGFTCVCQKNDLTTITSPITNLDETGIVLLVPDDAISVWINPEDDILLGNNDDAGYDKISNKENVEIQQLSEIEIKANSGTVSNIYFRFELVGSK